MELHEVRQVIDTYYAAGRSREETVEIVSAIPINGEEADAFGYIDLKYNTIPTQAPDRYNLTDAGNAEYFTALYGDRLRYDHRRGRWLQWHKHCWRPETDGHITRLALKSTRERYKTAVSVEDLDFRAQIAKWAISSEQRARLEATIAIAKNLLPIADSGDNWDTDPRLFCVENGVLDLRTGELRDGKPADRITMQSLVTFVPDAQCPLWLQFLDRITASDTELQTYLQRDVGYSLTGEIKHQAAFLLYGLGNNGKTTFTMTVKKLLGEYAQRMDAEDLMLKDKKQGGNPKESIANLRSKRFVLGSELQDGRRLDVSLIKDMTGGESIKARRLYEHETEFLPTHKLWLYGNHKPIIADTTLSIWRRVKLIPFTVTIPDSEVDPDLPVKLETELPGILNWALKGCLDWQQHGLNEPDTVTDATARYRHEQDILGDFIEDCCVLEPLVSIPKSELKEAYLAWCQDNSIEPITQRTFRIRLTEKGIGEGRIGKARYWRGIRLRTETDNDSLSDKSDKTLENSRLMTNHDSISYKPPPCKENIKDFIEKPVSNVTQAQKVTTLVTNDDIPEYPTEYCRACGGGDYYLTNDNRWLCSKCHPKPGGE